MPRKPCTCEPCSYDPVTLLVQPIGMYHCPECFEMVIAGLPHPEYHTPDCPHYPFEDS